MNSSSFQPYSLLVIFLLTRALLLCGDLINFCHDLHAKTTPNIFLLLSSFRPLYPPVSVLSPMGRQTWMQSCAVVEQFFMKNPRTGSVGEFDNFAKTLKCCEEDPHWLCPAQPSLVLLVSSPHLGIALGLLTFQISTSALTVRPALIVKLSGTVVEGSIPHPISEFWGITFSLPCLHLLFSNDCSW